MRYVRVPGQKRTYGVNVKVDLSTKFADWIETNLLKVDSSKVRKVSFNSRKFVIDVNEIKVDPGEIVTIRRKDSGGPWTLVNGTVPEGQELDTDKLSTMSTALADLKIVGVRRKPEPLKAAINAAAVGEFKPMSRSALNAVVNSLINKGFFPDQEGHGLCPTRGKSS